MQPKVIIRCWHLHCKTDALMNGLVLRIAVCNGIENENGFFQQKLRLLLDRYKSSVTFNIYEDAKALLEEIKEQDIIFIR